MVETVLDDVEPDAIIASAAPLDCRERQCSRWCNSDRPRGVALPRKLKKAKAKAKTKAKAVAKAKAKSPAAGKRLRIPPRGPRRWLEEDQLVAYQEVTDAGGNASDLLADRQDANSDAWRNAFQEYKRRQQMALAAAAAQPTAAPDLGAPAVPGGSNWLSLGPTVVMDGQTGGGERQPVGGRVAGLAIGPGGTVIYAASANGGQK